MVFKKENKIISKNSKVLIETNSNAFLIMCLNSKISCIFTSFKKEISNLSHIAKKLLAQQYSKTAYKYRGHRCVKKNSVLANFMRKI